jgi:hypothetical protein
VLHAVTVRRPCHAPVGFGHYEADCDVTITGSEASGAPVRQLPLRLEWGATFFIGALPRICLQLPGSAANRVGQLGERLASSRVRQLSATSARRYHRERRQLVIEEIVSG